jgi:hypothetical protein
LLRLIRASAAMPSAIGLKSEVKSLMRLSPRLYVLILENQRERLCFDGDEIHDPD